MSRRKSISRRALLESMLAGGLGAALLPFKGLAMAAPDITKRIPSSGEALPLVGLGSWITFNVGNDRRALNSCADVVRAFFAAGGRLIDSSPMYGSSQATIGYALNKLGDPETLFAADKVWTSSAARGPTQIEQSRRHWDVRAFDLLQVHNLRAWERHLDLLFGMKDEGRLRYVGVTTSHGRRHGDLERIMKRHPLDFVQMTYNASHRAVERRLLPLARERGIAVIANRPYDGGRLIRRAKREVLPSWAAEIGAANWPEFLLKFVVSHPAVNCAIPATTQVVHVRENMRASSGLLPDQATRRRMAAHIRQL